MPLGYTSAGAFRLQHPNSVISTEASWLYRDAQWRDLQFARAGTIVDTSKLQVSPLRRKSAPSVEMTILG